MLHIIMCDDDKFILQLASERINNQILKRKIDAKIVCMVTNPKEMFRFLESNPGDYLFFLDLDLGLGELNGIDIARRIKKDNQVSKIVFVTNHQEMAMQVLSSGVEPFGFLEKTTDMSALSMGYEKYIRMALTALGEKNDKEQEIKLTVGIDEYVTLKISQITYVETEKTMSHGITYHTVDNSKITVRDTIEHVMELLGEDFIKCHRSIIVNKKQMIALEANQIRLSNMEEIPCSIRMKNEVKKWMA